VRRRNTITAHTKHVEFLIIEKGAQLRLPHQAPCPAGDERGEC
jgi:hypothetical protein